MIRMRRAYTHSRKSLTIIVFTLFLIILKSLHIHAQYDSITHDGISRTYLLYLPTGYAKTNTYPLVVTMHGGTGNAYNIQNQSQLSIKANTENFIVVYPEGVKGGLLNVRTWNAGWCCGYASESNTDDVGFINALLDTLINYYPIDTNRIYATGMSNGGFMTYRLACELSNRIAAIAPVAASMSLANCSPLRSMPIMHFHSYLDTNVPYYGGIGTGLSNHYNPPVDSVLNAWAIKDNCLQKQDTVVNNNEYTEIKWTSGDCNSEIYSYTTTDGGHSWPGGKQTPIGDPVSAYISATDLMWAFFQQHSLNCNTSVRKELKKQSKISLFPNPTNNKIQISYHEPIVSISITVYNQTGQAILHNQNMSTINLKDYPEGIYYVSIILNGKLHVKKIIKNPDTEQPSSF